MVPASALGRSPLRVFDIDRQGIAFAAKQAVLELTSGIARPARSAASAPSSGLVDRRVLVDGRGPVDRETMAARRPITLRGASDMGNLGTNDPSNKLVGVMLTTDAFAGPFPPTGVIGDLQTGAFSALGN